MTEASFLAARKIYLVKGGEERYRRAYSLIQNISTYLMPHVHKDTDFLFMTASQVQLFISAVGLVHGSFCSNMTMVGPGGRAFKPLTSSRFLLRRDLDGGFA